MLTRDLLRFHTLSGYAKPMFVPVGEQRILHLAEELLRLYRAGRGLPRTETDAAVQAEANRWTDLKLPRGMIKILDDACEYSGTDSAEYPELRRKLFEASSAILSSGNLPETDKFRQAVFAAAGLPERDEIYADLPDFERLEKVPEWGPDEFLDRYNCSLAQSLLIYASAMDLTIYEPEPAKLRRFFKYLKFFRLLASAKAVSWRDSAPMEVKLHIDGPASILEQSSAYGIRLASFFPAVLQLGKWKMSALVKPGARELKLVLDEKNGLIRRFGNYSAYVPEEIRMFETLFRKQSSEWTITEETPFVRLAGQNFLFPDMTFSNGKRSVHLELFHKWHAGKLPERLEYLAQNPDFPLLIGADRSLFPRKQGGTAGLEENPLYGKKIFLFRDFPGVERVLKLLGKEGELSIP